MKTLTRILNLLSGVAFIVLILLGVMLAWRELAVWLR